MKVDFSTPIMSANRTPVMDGDKPLVLSTVCTEACLAVLDNDQQMKGDEKVRIWKLAARIVDGGIHDITAEEAALLKARVDRRYVSALVVGQVWPLLDGNSDAAAA